jgi:iron complex transport system substrate-binding protein
MVPCPGICNQHFPYGVATLKRCVIAGTKMRREGLLLLMILTFMSWTTALAGASGRRVRDDLGREIMVPDHPHRLICLSPSVADTVYAIGAGSDVIAVSDFTKYPAEARRKPSVGLPLSPSWETIVSLHPDLVIGSSDFGGSEFVSQMKQVGIPYFLTNPHGLEGIYDSVLSLGKALNREAEAKQVVWQLRRRVGAVQARTKDKPSVRVFMLIWHEPITTIGKRSFITEIIAAAGGKSISSDLEQEWPQISFESLVARAPESILLVRGAKMSFDDLAKRPEWNGVAAIREHRVFYTDDRLYSPSPVAIDALENLAGQFHPGGGPVPSPKP